MSPKSDSGHAVADVYAGDAAYGTLSAQRVATFAFHVEADADPDVLARVAGSFIHTNTAPLSARLQRHVSGVLSLTIEMDGISVVSADLIRRKLLQLTSVVSVALTQGPIA